MNFKKAMLLFIVAIIAFVYTYFAIVIPISFKRIGINQILVRTGLNILFVLLSTFSIKKIK